MRQLSLVIAAGLFGLSTPVMAQAPAGHEPPPEAFTACAGQTEGAAVTITAPDGKTMTATCTKGPDGRLAARPDKGPGKGGPGGHPGDRDGNRPEPPAEAFTACSGQSEGATVTMATPDGHSMTATCAKMPDGRLAARPDKMEK